jgi:hypothetical protein
MMIESFTRSSVMKGAFHFDGENGIAGIGVLLAVRHPNLSV